MTEYQEILASQKTYFQSGNTRSIAFRKKQLKKLFDYLVINEKKIEAALWSDLRKGEFESYGTETGICRSEIRLLLRKLNSLTREKRVGSPLVLVKSRSFIIHEPYGVNLIISPWNYPLMLCLMPLAGAIAAGNTAIVKPSEISTATGSLISEMISELFDRQYIACVKGGAEVSQELLKLKFDHIFFTGSSRVGKLVMEAASKNLIPVSLELGGKNPVIVDQTVDVDLAAKRIAWGKFTNGGQACVAPDYLYVHKSIKDELIKKIIYYIEKFYGKDPGKSKDFLRIVNEANFHRLTGLLKGQDIIYGGASDLKTKYLGPTLVNEPDTGSLLMQDEIFGPILPVLSFEDIDCVIEEINKLEKPLSSYIFSESKLTQEKILSSVSSGNASINDTVVQFANSNLPFGGVGHSGMGAYHGIYSFYTFSYPKSVLKRSNLFDLPFRYPPYDSSKLWLVKKFIR